ncbi:MAG: BMP family ABC transporter substrate-binding protein [Acidimicrobiia bacterium]|nr:BMP family ABC transporter substrate-binding protein [Acidimicrobiia bacterium]
MKSLRLLFALLAVFGLVAAACGDDGEDTGTGDGTETTEPADDPCVVDQDALDAAIAAVEEGGTDDTDEGTDDGADLDGSGMRVGMVYDIGGKGDQSFNDAAFEGLTRAQEDFGFEVEDLEPSAGGENRGELLQLLADEDYDLIIGVGFAFEEIIAEVAGNYPDITFAVVDAAPEADNIKGLVFAEEEGSFLVGAAAALTTETDHVGFIGGVESPLIQKFEAGFVCGVHAVNPDIEIDSTYITQPPDFAGFNDPARGGEIASSMYEDGADIVYHAAGGSGGGLFETAYDNGDVWAIGVDSDQYLTVGEPQNERILTSMLKEVDVAVYGAIEDFISGDTAGGATVFDLSIDGVGYSTEGGFIEEHVPTLEGYKSLIIDGTIEVPDTPGS